mgnify:CR=1 FL=1
MQNKKNKINFDIIGKIEKVRSKNNTNWMDILRLAFKYAPIEAKRLVKKINKDDKKISNLLKKLGN